MKIHQILSAFLLISSSVFAQTSGVEGDIISAPDKVDPGGFFWVDIKGDVPYTITPKPEKLSEYPPDVNGLRLLLIREAKAPGYTISVSYRITHPTKEEIAKAREYKGDQAVYEKYISEHSEDEVYQDSKKVEVGKAPNPPPDPDDPDVDPDKEPPIPLPGLRVLIIEEQAERNKLPEGQRQILYSTAFRNDYLDKVCTDGIEVPSKKEWRIFDKDEKYEAVAKDGERWAKAMNRPRQSVPWIIVSNGKTGYEGPLPANPQEAMALIDKYKLK